MRKRSKEQSAMEYLMTYGWSILLVAIVLVAVFALGGFNSSPLSSSNSCLSQSGYLCSKPILNSSGFLTAIVGQNNGGSETVTAIACTNSSSAPTIFTTVSPVTLYTGQSAQFSFNCPIASSSLGTPFSGSLWIKYNYGGSTGAVTKVGNVNIAVTTTSGVGFNSCNPATFTISNSINFGGSSNPDYPSITPNGKYIYLSNSWSPGNVFVVSTSNNTVVNSITVGATPSTAAITPNGQYVYVPNANSGTVSVIATSNNTVVKTITAATVPGVAVITPNGNYVFVNGVYVAGGVTAISTANNMVMNAIAFTSGSYPSIGAVTQNSNYVYVSTALGTVQEIATVNDMVVNTITVGSSPGPAVMTPNGSYLYVSNSGSGTVSVISTSNNIVVGTITVGSSPKPAVISPNGNYAYVTNSGSATVSVIATSNNIVVGTVTLSGTPGVGAITPSGAYLYVPSFIGFGGGAVYVVSTANNMVASSISIGSPATPSISSSGSYVYVPSDSFSGVLSVISNYGC